MEQISVSDLSIGDWVRVRMCKWDYDDPDTLDAKVLSIEGNSVGVGYDECGICMSAFVDDLQPIPITAEVLEKNGWSEFSDYHNSWKLDIASDKRIWMFKNSHDWTFQVMSWGLGHNHSVAKAYIKDVHELQHALRLAKLGEDIVL